jgi:hypothetical protein
MKADRCACAHLTYARCESSCCYHCGMSEDACLVDQDEELRLDVHNKDRKKHADRYSMNLVIMYKLDDRWSQDYRDGLAYLHRARTSCELNQILKIDR